MSRHRNVKKLNYADEYDDYYGAFEDEDDDFDLDDGDFAAKYLSSVKKQPPQKQSSSTKDEQSTPRFEYSGKPGTKQKQQNQKSNDKANQANKTKNPQQPSTGPKDVGQPKPGKSGDLTIQEDFTAEQLDKISKKYKESLNTESNKTNSSKNSVKFAELISTNKAGPSSSSAIATDATTKVSQPKKLASATTAKTNQPAKQLATLTEKRISLKQRLKQNTEPSAQDWEAFRLKAIQTTKEYGALMKGARPRLNLVVVGHVDSGKSTLVGHLLYKLGQVSNKQMHRNEVDSQRSGKGSFKFAWALDETDEERARGVTIDIALTKFETPQKDVILLDAPGHVDFIPAVISGAAQADVALLVVDATRGEFETGFTSGGQTREHTFLVRSLGVKSLVVVVNKMDNVDWNWNRFHDIVEQLKPFLKQVGFNLKDDVQFIPVSGLTGDNLVERRQDKLLKQSSHPQLENLTGTLDTKRLPCLLEAIDQMKPPERMVDKPTRVCVTDVFKGMSSGVFLGAKVISGKIEQKQKLLLLPPGELCEIKQVEVRDDRSAQCAYAGDIITTTAMGIDMSKFYRGCILCDPVITCSVTNRFQARIIMFHNASTILVKGTPIEVHMNGAYESGEVRKLISLLNKNSGELIQRKPRCVAQNSSAIIQLRLSRVVCCELYENNKDLGRFMMRSFGKTIAAGLIVKIKPAKVSRSGKSKMKSKS
uniref:HBS1-like protein n=2 Tax=Aceria tosichella TaxID=561515 RepID=A0A6G1S2V2_9ACAR